jgi:aryl sulfotransferase
MDSLPGVRWHLSDAWTRRAEPNVLLVHYDDLAADLDAEMRRIAAYLELPVDELSWPNLVRRPARRRTDVSRTTQLAPPPASALGWTDSALDRCPRPDDCWEQILCLPR